MNLNIVAQGPGSGCHCIEVQTFASNICIFSFFIYPTPDIRFDIKRALFPSFETFIRTHGFVENDYMFERNIRSIQFHEKELKTMQNKRGSAEEATYINIES